jgi:hypothetical protein
MKFLLFFLCVTRCVYSYVDDELLDLWSSVSDIYGLGSKVWNNWRVSQSFAMWGISSTIRTSFPYTDVFFRSGKRLY